MDIDQAKQLAREAHGHQADKAKRDYVDAHLTPIAAAARVFGRDAGIAGWLHDVLEDTPVTADELRDQGLSETVIAAVESVTKRTGEPYEAMIERACADPLGYLVKLVDNAWNITSAPVLAALDPDAAAAGLRDRYLPARERLLAAAGLTPESPDVRAVQAVLDEHHERLTRG